MKITIQSVKGLPIPNDFLILEASKSNKTMEKYSFKISWLDEEQKFQVKLMYGNKELEVTKYEWHSDMFDYISETMAGLQIAGEDWTLSY